MSRPSVPEPDFLECGFNNGKISHNSIVLDTRNTGLAVNTCWLPSVSCQYQRKDHLLVTGTLEKIDAENEVVCH